MTMKHNSSATVLIDTIRLLGELDGAERLRLLNNALLMQGPEGKDALSKYSKNFELSDFELALNETIAGLSQHSNNAQLFYIALRIIILLLEKTGNQDEFTSQLLNEVEYSYDKVQENNTCYIRFPRSYVDKKTLHDALQFLLFIINNLASYKQTYNMLNDHHSRTLMVKLLSFWTLGGRRVKLPTNNDMNWKLQELAYSLPVTNKAIPIGISDEDGEPWYLDLIPLAKINYPIMIYGLGASVLYSFLLKQYEYKQSNISIAAEEGDYVVDGGGCWGDTALYFANKVGRHGKVFSFEFLPFNVSIMQKNLFLNRNLADRIEIIQHAVWNVSGQKIPYHAGGPGTHLDVNASETAYVLSKSIDDFVSERNLSKVDMIKLDVEGSELAALKGAEVTIRKFRPKLAICVYHKQDDFITIPQYINQLNLGYKFYMDHFTIHTNETILFASKEICA